MKKIVLSLCCVVLVALSSVSFALNQKASNASYKGQAFAAGKLKMDKIGGFPTDVFIINNTPDSLLVTSPSASNDYLGGNGIYRLTSFASIQPQIILWHPVYGYFYNQYVAPHSIISFSIQYGVANTLTVEYN